ncbi:MAG: type II toxin-antitoxin system VapC family toxin [Thioploca sp.]|nr:type II toxin-antitoxin system VapC family toxin [Thioploca sp.]
MPNREDFGMNGNAFLLDTNTVIALLRGESGIRKSIAPATWLGIAVITVIEFNSFRALIDEDRHLFQTFCSQAR